MKVCLYIRLSSADKDLKFKDESESIANQRALLHQYLRDHKEFFPYEVVEFVDDGFTGTNGNRPGFERMIDFLKNGGAKLVLCKDLSRFFRDYVEIGEYLERIFPFLGVRLIAVNDGYDSDDYKGTTGGLEVVMRNIIYAVYSKDLSIKTTSAKLQMMKQGKYVGGYAPYGYKIHPTVRNKLAIDPDSAVIVRRIFDEAMAGKTVSEIAKGLNDNEIPTPGQYFRANHPGKNNFIYMSDKISWNPPMIYRILTKPVYTGATVGHAMKIAAPLSKKRVKADKSDRIIVENMHEPIVTKAEFEVAQKAIRKEGKKAPRKMSDYPLQGLVRCGNCKRAMRRRIWNNKAYFTCMNSRQDRDTECAVGEHYAEDELERIAFSAIKQVIQLAEQEHVQKKQAAEKRKNAVDKAKRLQSQAEQLKVVKLRLYEKYAADEILREAYLKAKAELDGKLAENEREVKEAMLDSPKSEVDAHLIEAYNSYKSVENLTYDLAHAFIKGIYVCPGDMVEIEWKFGKPDGI